MPKPFKSSSTSKKLQRKKRAQAGVEIVFRKSDLLPDDTVANSRSGGSVIPAKFLKS